MEFLFKKITSNFAILLLPVLILAQNKAEILSVPGSNQFCKIDAAGITVLPSGRYLKPAGNLIRITNDPFGLAISPDGKKR